jgi:hypothetical protein
VKVGGKHKATKPTVVLDKHIASFFRVEEQAEQETSMKTGGKQRV